MHNKTNSEQKHKLTGEKEGEVTVRSQNRITIKRAPFEQAMQTMDSITILLAFEWVLFEIFILSMSHRAHKTQTHTRSLLVANFLWIFASSPYVNVLWAMRSCCALICMCLMRVNRSFDFPANGTQLLHNCIKQIPLIHANNKRILLEFLLQSSRKWVTERNRTMEKKGEN